MDEIDRASEQEEWFRGMALGIRRPVPEHDGYCINCGKEAPGAYCDEFCKEDSERFDRARVRDGR